MSRKYPYGNGSEARAHGARIQGRRCDTWAASSPENTAKAKEVLLRNMGIPQEHTALSNRIRTARGTPSAPVLAQSKQKLTTSQSISGAVKAGVIAGGAISITQNLHQVLTGHKELKMAAKDVAIDVATAGATSAVIAGAAEGVKFAIKSTLPNVAKSFVKGSAPVVIASGVVELAVDAYKGNLTAKTATITVARTAGGWAGAEAGAVGGAAVGAFLAPVTAGASVVAGAFIGGILGGISGALGFGKLAELAVS